MLSLLVRVTPLVGLDLTADATAGDAKHGSFADGANADARFNAPRGLVTVETKLVIETHSITASGCSIEAAGASSQSQASPGKRAIEMDAESSRDSIIRRAR